MTLRLCEFASLPLAGLVLSVQCTPAWARCVDEERCSCLIDVTPMMLGTYDPQAPQPTDSAAAVMVACRMASTETVSVTISAGNGHSGRATARTLIGDRGTLFYNLYKDPARRQLWGDDLNGGASIIASVPGQPGSQLINVYARIEAGQSVAAGPYTDVVLITLEF